MHNLEKLLEAREQMITNNPKLRVLQDEIDRVMDASVTQADRSAAIQLMLASKMSAMVANLALLQSMLSKETK